LARLEAHAELPARDFAERRGGGARGRPQHALLPGHQVARAHHVALAHALDRVAAELRELHAGCRLELELERARHRLRDSAQLGVEVPAEHAHLRQVVEVARTALGQGG
jgi:hypothetical protein